MKFLTVFVAVTLAVVGMSATVTLPEPFFVTPPELIEAEIDTGPPSATEVTRPPPFTVAIVVSLDDQVGAGRPAI